MARHHGDRRRRLHVLWIAHWNTPTPTLPANDWQGNGWKIWQYSNCGDVPGIDGCVDLDYFNGLDFAPIIIPSPDTVAPVATIATPTRRHRTRHGQLQRDRPRRVLGEPAAPTGVIGRPGRGGRSRARPRPACRSTA